MAIDAWYMGAIYKDENNEANEASSFSGYFNVRIVYFLHFKWNSSLISVCLYSWIFFTLDSLTQFFQLDSYVLHSISLSRSCSSLCVYMLHLPEVSSFTYLFKLFIHDFLLRLFFFHRYLTILLCPVFQQQFVLLFFP